LVAEPEVELPELLLEEAGDLDPFMINDGSEAGLKVVDCEYPRLALLQSQKSDGS
jgi:hypothetical protein